jgi:hypothetical protein
LKSAWANSFRDPISKKTLHKNRAGGVAQGDTHEFKPQYCKKEKETKGNEWDCVAIVFGQIRYSYGWGHRTDLDSGAALQEEGEGRKRGRERVWLSETGDS